jgi:chloramphenicol O-acetyltransferase type A
MKTWSRRDHFKLFSALDYPYFSLCTNVDLAAFYPFVKQRGISFTVATVYVLTRAANEIPEFRYRIREGEVIEHGIVHPGITILTNEELFTFCTFEYNEDFSLFAERAEEQIACAKEHPTLEDEPGQDDLLFMTSIPWVSFTSAVHPINLHPVDSVPRIAWGKFFEEGKILKMPVGLQAHHALMDGIHVGRFYEKVQDYFHRPDSIIGEN